jgi:hypothetical integral membrane protein (TIGR02206 family)
MENEFRMFGAGHAGALVLLLVLGALVAWAGRTASAAARSRLGRSLGILLLAYGAVRYLELGLRGLLSWSYSLPLELCHWVLVACVTAAFTRKQLASEIAYFWGFGGTLQAVLTPELFEGFPSWEFIQFFWSHGVILLTIVYLVSARDFRPRPRSVLRMMLAVNLYLVIAGTLDLVFGWNYGYLMRPPAQPSLLDYLGPWPWYLLSLELVAVVTFWLLALPWTVSDRMAMKAKTESGDGGEHGRVV